MSLKKFIVHKANIKDEKGNKRRHEEVVELGPKLARHYGKLGFLRPYFEEGEQNDDESDEPDVGKPSPEPVRARRVPPQPSGAEVRAPTPSQSSGSGDGTN